MNHLATVVVTAVASEPLAAIVHRAFGHGRGWPVHRDHHTDPAPRLQRNDLIPASLAAATMAAMAGATAVPALAWLMPYATGVTIYGLAYSVVHEVYIHRRLPLLPARIRVLEPWRRAHLRHHATGGRPFGVLIPWF